MSFKWSHLSLFIFIFLVFCSAFTATTREKNSTTSTLVQEALHREIYGQVGEREKLLNAALAKDPNDKLARSHKGYVQYAGRWVKSDEMPKLVESNSKVVAYRRMRDKLPNTAAGQLELAEWCAARELFERERAHLNQVLNLDSNNADARRRLGYQLINGRWASDDELAATERQANEIRKSVESWRDVMQTTIRVIDDPAAVKQLLDLCDSSAIWAIEVYLAAESDRAAQLTIRLLSGMQEKEATSALARQAAFSRWESVRKSAAKQLKRRNAHNYVPFLLSQLSTPMEPRKERIRYRNGRLVHQRTLMREGEKDRDLVVYETAYRRIARDGGNASDTLEQTVKQLSKDIRDGEAFLERQIERRKELNGRIASSLRTATDQQLPNDPHAWWRWWNDYNEVYVEGQKPEQVVLHTNNVDIIDYVPPPPPPPRSSDCLAAGTAIWTADGPTDVEKILVGDLVLSRDIETGELAYKPVLRTTIRPKTQLIRIHTAKETIEASGGHPFWVSGEGWIKARKLASGMELHGVKGTTQITSIDLSKEEVQTYNLEVADLHSYFVGASRVLSHDNSIRQPTDMVVPGLK